MDNEVAYVKVFLLLQGLLLGVIRLKKEIVAVAHPYNHQEELGAITVTSEHVIHEMGLVWIRLCGKRPQ